MKKRLTQNNYERIKDQFRCGVITLAQANVEMVLSARVELVIARIPREVRVALNDAVKSGVLAHMKKSGNKPEVYYNPRFEDLAHKDRAEHERKMIDALKAVAGFDTKKSVSAR